MKTLKNWAKREIELATAGEDHPLKEEIDKHYDAAYQAYCAFVNHLEGLDKPGIMKTIFLQLFGENPLTPIEDNSSDWSVVDGFDPEEGGENPGYSIYQCKRRPLLFKKVAYDRKTGDVEMVHYTDDSRYVCVDINSCNQYKGGIGPAILNEMIPITMPYQPTGVIKIYTEDFKYHEDFDGDFDTVAILYFRLEDGQMKDVKRFFKEDYKTHEMKEIDKSEYFARKKRAEDRKGKIKK